MLKARLIIEIGIDTSNHKTGNVSIYTYDESITITPGDNTYIYHYTTEVYPNVPDDPTSPDLHISRPPTDEGSRKQSS